MVYTYILSYSRINQTDKPKNLFRNHKINKQLIVNSPVSVTLTCMRPMWVPIRAGSFSREKALYGAMIVACATCHAEPKRVTESRWDNAEKQRQKNKQLAYANTNKKSGVLTQYD